MIKNKNALIIFARKPELGKVKTRLAATVVTEKALEIYKKLLAHTRSTIKAVLGNKYIFVTHKTADNFWEDFNLEIQNGDSLGEKMQNAFLL